MDAMEVMNATGPTRNAADFSQSVRRANGREGMPWLRECQSPSAEDRLPKSLRFAESDVIIFVVRASGVHELGYGHKWDWEA